MNFFYRKFIWSILAVITAFISVDVLHSQIKVNESFSGEIFPPAEWSVFDVQGSGSSWHKSERYCRSGEGCAISEFDTTYGNSFLITKRIVPVQNDSLVFYLRQTFYRVYNDTLKIFASTSDSLPSSMSNLLLTIRDGLNYPPHQMYSRYAISLSQFAGDTLWIGFQHIDVNGDILRIDDVRIGNSLQNDIAVTEILSPKDIFGLCSFDSISPRAVITNNGLNIQSSDFTVTFRINGPVSFVREINTNIASGESKTLTFGSISPDVAGEYEVKVYTSLFNDELRQNDTLKSSFSVKQYSSGSGDGGYFYASSEICGEQIIPRPEFCWKDTASRIMLLKNGIDVSRGLLRGNIDNGYFALGNILPERKEIKFFENTFDSLFISLNGFVTFQTSPQLFSPEPNDSSVLSNNGQIIAPLWMDFDNSQPGLMNEISYKVAGNTLLITFDRMHLKGGDSLAFATFQIAISLQPAENQNSEILMQYSSRRSGATLRNQLIYNSEVSCYTGIAYHDQKLSYRLKYDGRYIEAGKLLENDMAIQFGSDPLSLNSKCSMLSVNALLEGYQDRRDTIIISLHERNSPEKMVESVKTVLETGGSATAQFTLADKNSEYFISVNHRNSIETWSKDTTLKFISSNMHYDFTADSSSAYGNNMKMINGKAHIFSGDVNQDGLIEIADGSLVINDAFDYRLGYLRTDLNGDGIVDSSDLIMVDENIANYVRAIIPLFRDKVPNSSSSASRK